MTHPITPTELTAVLCAEALGLLPGSALTSRVRALRQRLDDPVRLAIVGAAGAGVSTLVNALTGDRLAATAPGGATATSVWYRAGARHEAYAVLRDGSLQPVGMDRSDGLVLDLGSLDRDDIVRFEVCWPALLLQQVTIIDTPLAGDGEAGSDADAVIVVLRDAPSDPDALPWGSELTTPSPVNTLTVITRADEVGNGRPDAMDIAAGRAAVLQGSVASRTRSGQVVAVCGLLAEASLALTPAQVASLRALSIADPEETAVLLRTADRFITTDDAPVPATERAALLGRLGLFGVRWCLEALRHDREMSTAALRAALRHRSGITALEEAIALHVMPRSPVLRASAVLNGLRAVAHDLAAADERRAGDLLRAIERTAASIPELDEVRILHLALSGRLPISEGDVADLQQLWSSGTNVARLGLPATTSASTVHALVLAAIGRWRERGDDMFATPQLRDACATIARSYESIFLALHDTDR